MATQGVPTWSTTAATNSTADPAINAAEGMAPSALNDAIRAVMASVAKYRDDISGSTTGLTTGGSSTAYTVTTNSTYATAGAMSGAIFTIIPHATSGAAPTLAVDGLTARAINQSTGVAVSTGALVLGTPYTVKYIHASTEFIVLGHATGSFPAGTIMLFVQTAAPTGWTKGVDLDDFALRVTAGTVTTHGTTAFSSIFAARTITQANLPNVNLTTIITDPGHTHTYTTTNGTGANSPAGSGNAYPLASGFVSNGTTTGGTGATGITASTALGGSGTTMDFAVKYVDVIYATKT